MKTPGYGLADTEAGKEYRRRVVDHVRVKGWTLYRAANHFHHSYETLRRWIKEFDDEQADDREPIVIIDEHDEPDKQIVKWVPERQKCLECVRLEAQLEVYKAIVQHCLGVQA